jgi:hypothetical protein
MKATLLSTDNEEVQDLVGTSDFLTVSDHLTYEFQDMVFVCKFMKKLADGNTRIVSTLGNTYLFKIL